MNQNPNSKSCSSIVTSIFIILSIIILIVCIVFLFKIRKNAKNEPSPRTPYYNYDDVSNYYVSGDFCYNHLDTYIEKGAFADFDIKMSKIRKYSTVLLSLYFVQLALLIFAFVLPFLLSYCESCTKVLPCIFLLINTIVGIISLVFFIILSYYIYKGKFGDLKTFSKCEYLTRKFQTDYDFAFKIKNNFKKFFIMTIVSMCLTISHSIIGRIIICCS